MARSSTISQPTATRPFSVSSSRRSSSARSSTTVEATESERPKTRPPAMLQPHHSASPRPNSEATAICPTAPGTATLHTRIRSRGVKCRPTPNIKQDDAEFGKLRGERGIRDEARRIGADGEAGDEIADNGREPQPCRKISEDRRQQETDADGGDQRHMMRHEAGSPSGLELNEPTDSPALLWRNGIRQGVSQEKSSRKMRLIAPRLYYIAPAKVISRLT